MLQSQKSRILIVEDNEKLAEKYKRALKQIGDSRIAGTSDQVFEQIVDFDPQVILLDIVLQGEKVHETRGAGIYILKRIKKLRVPFREIPIIIVTGLIEPEVEIQCREFGAAAFFEKPVSIQKLRQAVKKALAEYLCKNKRFKIFISSVVSELETERWIVRYATEELGPQYNPQIIENYSARPEPRNELCLKAVKECDIFILLLGEKYETQIEAEYNAARETGKPILIFVKDVDVAKREPRLEAFLSHLRDPNTGYWVKLFSTNEQLRTEVMRAFKEMNLQDKVSKKVVDGIDAEIESHSEIISKQLEKQHELRKNIVNFLISLSLLETERGRQAFMCAAGIEEEIGRSLNISDESFIFCNLLVTRLMEYGTLRDGRDALIAVLGEAKEHVGKNQQEKLDKFIEEWRVIRQKM